jgi:Tfp pilus assembly protein PilN
MDAASRQASGAVLDLDCVLATLVRYQSPVHDRRLDAVLLTIESARELLCDAREARAAQLLQHARRVLAQLPQVEAIKGESGLVVTRHLDSALTSLGCRVN